MVIAFHVYLFCRRANCEAVPLTWMFWKKRRYIVVLMAFLGFFNVYSLRVNLSVGIVAMTEKRPIEYENGTIGYVSGNLQSIPLLSGSNRKILKQLFSTGTRLSVEYQGTWIDTELIFLGIHNDTILGRIIWCENWWQFGEYEKTI